jgi:hypothetical protein
MLIRLPNNESVDAGALSEADVETDNPNGDLGLLLPDGTHITLSESDLWVVRDLIRMKPLPDDPHPAKYRRNQRH